MTAYATGMRVSELCSLRGCDIDSSPDRMCIRVVAGKGGHDRYSLLTPELLEQLRLYWRQCRSHARPEDWLFPARLDPSKALDTRSAGRYFHIARNAAGIDNSAAFTRCATASPHTCSKPASTSTHQSVAGPRQAQHHQPLPAHGPSRPQRRRPRAGAAGQSAQGGRQDSAEGAPNAAASPVPAALTLPSLSHRRWAPTWPRCCGASACYLRILLAPRAAAPLRAPALPCSAAALRGACSLCAACAAPRDARALRVAACVCCVPCALTCGAILCRPDAASPLAFRPRCCPAPSFAALTACAPPCPLWPAAAWKITRAGATQAQPDVPVPRARTVQGVQGQVPRRAAPGDPGRESPGSGQHRGGAPATVEATAASRLGGLCQDAAGGPGDGAPLSSPARLRAHTNDC